MSGATKAPEQGRDFFDLAVDLVCAAPAALLWAGLATYIAIPRNGHGWQWGHVAVLLLPLLLVLWLLSRFARPVRRLLPWGDLYKHSGPKAQKQTPGLLLAEQDKPLAKELTKEWYDTMRQVGLAIPLPKVPTPTGQPETPTEYRVPRLVSIESVPVGLRLCVEPTPGQTVDQVVAAAAHMAVSLGVPVEAKPDPASTDVYWTAVLRNPLEGSRSVALDGGWL